MDILPENTQYKNNYNVFYYLAFADSSRTGISNLNRILI